MLIQVANLKENLFVWFVLQLLLDCSFIHGIFFRENDFTKISRKTAAIFLLWWWCEYCLFFWSVWIFLLFLTQFTIVYVRIIMIISALLKKSVFWKIFNFLYRITACLYKMSNKIPLLLQYNVFYCITSTTTSLLFFIIKSYYLFINQCSTRICIKYSTSIRNRNDFKNIRQLLLKCTQ